MAGDELEDDASKAPDIRVPARSRGTVYHFRCGPVDVTGLEIGLVELFDLTKVGDFADPVLRNIDIGRSQGSMRDIVCVEILEAL